MSARRPLIAGNWKMNKTGAEARSYCERLLQLLGDGEGPEVAVCPPFTALEIVAVALAGSGVWAAAQTMHEAPSGPHTGEISALMIVAAGARGVVIGHSERRAAGETDAQVGARARAALDHDLTPIVCVGESLDHRQAGETFSWLSGQVRAALAAVRPDEGARLAIAYEPIWAIGTGQTATPEIAQEACAHVRAVAGERLDPAVTRVLYGGSVTPENTAGLMAQSDIDGALVGGASLDPESFARIVGAA
ncbi:MAG TPA: triose-phosphate isomerase [Miltoncostaeaceae bacterium]|nr:triose-phosphate isomerase [Miltoncostaeaceae bacterium]